MAEAAIDLFEEYGRYTINLWIVRVSFEYPSGFVRVACLFRVINEKEPI